MRWPGFNWSLRPSRALRRARRGFDNDLRFGGLYGIARTRLRCGPLHRISPLLPPRVRARARPRAGEQRPHVASRASSAAVCMPLGRRDCRVLLGAVHWIGSRVREGKGCRADGRNCVRTCSSLVHLFSGQRSNKTNQKMECTTADAFAPPPRRIASLLRPRRGRWVRAGRGVACGLCRTEGFATWLILPVVICLSQRLSHACVSMNNFRL